MSVYRSIGPSKRRHRRSIPLDSTRFLHSYSFFLSHFCFRSSLRRPSSLVRVHNSIVLPVFPDQSLTDSSVKMSSFWFLRCTCLRPSSTSPLSETYTYPISTTEIDSCSYSIVGFVPLHSLLPSYLSTYPD